MGEPIPLPARIAEKAPGKVERVVTKAKELTQKGKEWFKDKWDKVTTKPRSVLNDISITVPTEKEDVFLVDSTEKTNTFPKNIDENIKLKQGETSKIAPEKYLQNATQKISTKIAEIKNLSVQTEYSDSSKITDRMIRDTRDLVMEATDEYVMYLWDEAVASQVDELLDVALKAATKIMNFDRSDEIKASRFVNEDLNTDSFGFMDTIDIVVKTGYAKNALNQYKRNCENLSNKHVFTHEVLDTSIAESIIRDSKTIMSRSALELRGITPHSDRTKGVGEENAVFVDRDKFHSYGPVGWAFSVPRICEKGYYFGLRDLPFGYRQETDYKEGFFTNSQQAVDRGIISDGVYTLPVNQTTDDNTSLSIEDGVFFASQSQKEHWETVFKEAGYSPDWIERHAYFFERKEDIEVNIPTLNKKLYEIGFGTEGKYKTLAPKIGLSNRSFVIAEWKTSSE